MYQSAFWFLVATYFCGIQFVFGNESRFPRFLSLPSDEKESKMSFLSQATQQGSEISDFVCRQASMKERVIVCGAVIMLLRKFTSIKEFNEQKPVANYSKQHDHECREKDIVYQYAQKDTLKNVPMFFCSRYFIYFTATKEYGTTTNFYIKQGETPDDVLVFLDLVYSRESDSFEPLKNSVKLWHVVTVSEDEKDKNFDRGKTSTTYKRQLSDKLGGMNISEETDEQKKEITLKRQLSRELSRQLSRQISTKSETTRTRGSDEGGPSSRESDEKKLV